MKIVGGVLMKKCLPFIFAAGCLAALTQCRVGDQSAGESGQDSGDELNSIYMIHETHDPYKTEFLPETIPVESVEWARLGLEISGIDGMEEEHVLGPEEYSIVTPLDDPDPITGEVLVKVKYKDTHRYPDVSTAFKVTVSNGFDIAPHSDDDGNVVYSDRAVIRENAFVAGGVPVKVNIIPAESYEYIEGSLVAYSEGNTIPLTLINNEVYIDITYFGPGKQITLGARFRKAAGPLKTVGGLYYASLAEALNANSSINEIELTVVASFTEPGAVVIPAGTSIKLKSESIVNTIKLGSNARGAINVNGGGSLTLDATSGGIIIDGEVIVASVGRLAIAGNLFVKGISLAAMTIGVSGALSPAGYSQQINVSISGAAGVPVLEGTQGYTLTQEDCDKFIVNGSYMVKLQANNTGVTEVAVARRPAAVKLYASIQDAFAYSSGGSLANPDTITLLTDIDITSSAATISLASGKHIKLVPGGATRTVKRGAGGFGSLFTVGSGASLALEGIGNYELIIDGNGVTATAALVTVSDNGTFTMNAGAVLQNNKSSNNGGGVYITSNGSFNMNGGTISGNTSGNGGGGVYVNTNGIFNMSGGAIVAQDNDVYLKNGRVINVDELTGSVLAAKITPENTAQGTTILSGVDESTVTRFTFTDAVKMYIVLKGTYGVLADQRVHLSSKNEEYDTLEDAVSAATGNDTITLRTDITLSTTINISGKQIKLVPGGATRTVKRGAGGFGSLFTVGSGASLALEGSGNNKLIIDGNNVTATAALVSVQGTLTMNAGAVLQNNKSSNNGGGVYITSNGSFTMNGGTISGNTSGNGGGGVYVNTNGIFNMSGGAIVAEGNDVYLKNGRVINVSGLTGSGFAAKITPENIAPGTRILSNVNSSTVTRFTLNTGEEKRAIDLDGVYGVLADYKAYLSNGKGYTTLQNAVSAATGNDTITLWTDITLSTTINISGKQIKLVPGGGTRKVTRGAGGFGSLFTVGSGASLALEGSGNYQLIIDGNNVTATAALVSVQGGTLTMNAGAVLQNNKSSSNSGGVFVSNGSFNMTGGAISGNTAVSDGGGVYITSNSTFTMNGGTINGNGSIGGGGVYVDSGTFNMSGGASISGNTAVSSGGSNGGGVYVNANGTFNMSGGAISKNRASYRGGGIYIESGTFTMTDGIVYGSGDGGDNKNTSGNMGSSLYNRDIRGRVILFGSVMGMTRSSENTLKKTSNNGLFPGMFS